MRKQSIFVNKLSCFRLGVPHQTWVPSILDGVIVEAAQVGLPVPPNKQGKWTSEEGSLDETQIPDAQERRFQVEHTGTESILPGESKMPEASAWVYQVNSP